MTDSDDEKHEHLNDIPDDCGCAEVWEHLSEQRNQDNDEQT